VVTEHNYDDCVKIYSNHSKQLFLLGTVFRNKISRNMWSLLSSNPKKQYHLKQMAVILEKETNPRLPIYEYHIKILIASGIINVNQKMHNKHLTNFYSATPNVLLTSQYNNASNALFRISLWLAICE